MSEVTSKAAAERDQRRVGTLIATLEALPDPEARTCAKELVQGILELHAAGLDRLLAILADGGEQGRTAIEAMAREPSVSALLLLHGLHPHDLTARVQQAVNKLHAHLGADGIRIELLHVDERSIKLKLTGRWQGKTFSAAAITQEIEQAIFELAPDVGAIDIEGLTDVNVHPISFVPMSARQHHRVGANPEAAV